MRLYLKSCILLTGWLTTTWAECLHTFHPTSLDKGNFSYCVYHNIEEVLNVLVPALTRQPPLPEVMEVYHKDPTRLRAVLPLHHRKPFIVLEGVQGTKKTILAKRLAVAINGTYVRNPPRVMEKLYGYLDDHCPAVASAFAFFANYIVAEKAKRLLATMPVVLDRYWHGVTAFNLAKAAQAHGFELPSHDSRVYYWPTDLLMPDVAFYIMVSDEVVRNRLHDTKKKIFPKDFRQNIHTALLRMTEPKLWRINGNLNRMQVESQMSMRLYRMFANILYPEEQKMIA